MQAFRIHIADDVIDDLRTRLRRTRWPEQVPGIGWEQGTERDWVQRLVQYWADEFDWRAWEHRLAQHEHFVHEGIHFLHQRSERPDALPLILTHGWPSSFLDYIDMLPLLRDFHVVVPSLPGYAFSPRPPNTGVNYRYVADRWHRLMRSLGYPRYGAGGGDFGAGVSTFLAVDHPASVVGLHLTTPEIAPKVDAARLTEAERRYLAARASWEAAEYGYHALQSTKPQTVGYALNDSPAGLAAYLGEKWHSWSDETPSADFLCATLTLYWSTQTVTSSMRDYWDNRHHPAVPTYVDTPTAFAVFPHETVPEGEPPRVWLERLYDIQRWTIFPRGGHFAPVEQPVAVASDLGAFFSGRR